jgi:hypothetical protein
MSALLHRLRVIGFCLFLLLLIGFIIWRLNLAHEINEELAAIRAAGLPTNGQEADEYYPSVPEDQNAALKMEEVFSLMTNYPDERFREVQNFLFPSRKAVLSQTQTELIRGYCAMNSNALVQAERAIKLPGCRYPIDLSWGAGALLPHLPKLKALARAESFQVLLDPDDSDAVVSTMLGIARTLDDEPVLISKLVRFAIINMALEVLERRLNESGIDPKGTSDLSGLLDGLDQTNQMASGFIGERAMYVRYFRMSYAEIKQYASADDENSKSQAGPPLPGSQPFFFRVTGFFERDLRFYLQSMETNICLAETYPKDIQVVSNCESRIRGAARHNLYIMSSMLLPALESPIFHEANAIAKVRAAKVSLAIEGFRQFKGRLPESLNELVPQFLPTVPEDPYDGKPLRYHQLEKGYVVYSVGRDGHDNGGRERPDSIKPSDKTEYDVTFTVER